MSNFILARANSDGATITGSESLGDMSILNLQKRSLKRVFRSADETNTYIEVDFGSAAEIDLIALIAHNITSAGTVRVRAGTTTSYADYDSGELSPISGSDIGESSNLFLLLLNSSETYRYWKVEVVDAARDYIQIGRLYISKAFQPAKNMDYGEAQGFIDNSRVTRTTSGEPVPVIRDPFRYAEFEMSFGSKAELYGSVYDIEKACGVSKDVLYVQDPAETTYLQKRYVYGLLSGLSPIINENFQLYQKKFRIEEIPSWQ